MWDWISRGFWEQQQSALFDVRVWHPNAESYKDLEPQQIYRTHENEKKRLYSRRVLDIEHGTFTSLVFTTTVGMGKECLRNHSRLAKLIANKKREHYAKTMSWIRSRISFALLRSALVCLRGSRTLRRIQRDIKKKDVHCNWRRGHLRDPYFIYLFYLFIFSWVFSQVDLILELLFLSISSQEHFAWK